MWGQNLSPVDREDLGVILEVVEEKDFKLFSQWSCIWRGHGGKGEAGCGQERDNTALQYYRHVLTKIMVVTERVQWNQMHYDIVWGLEVPNLDFQSISLYSVSQSSFHTLHPTFLGYMWKDPKTLWAPGCQFNRIFDRPMLGDLTQR